MSRIGIKPIALPEKVKISYSGDTVTVQGPQGTLVQELLPGITVDIQDSQVIVNRRDDSKEQKARHGLFRSLISNMIIGVSTGWSKELEIVGVGYRVALQGKDLNINIGFSHPVIFPAPEGITFEVEPKVNKIKVKGIDKVVVGEVSAKIRDIRPPEPYKGKGIRYAGEYVRRKAGKAAV